MVILYIFLIIGIVIAYIKLEQENTKLKQEINLFKNKISQLEREARDQANKNIILQSLINQRENK